MAKEVYLGLSRFEILTINGVDYMKVKDAKRFIMGTYDSFICEAYQKAMKESKIEDLFDSCIVGKED